MDEARLVDRVERRRRLRGDLGGALRAERTVAPDQPAQVVAGDEAHRDVGDAVVLAGGVHGDHVGVLERGRRARLAQEAGADVGVLDQLGSDHLERDDPVEVELAGAIHDAHPTAADERLDPVAGDDHARREEAHVRCISEPAGPQ